MSAAYETIEGPSSYFVQSGGTNNVTNYVSVEGAATGFTLYGPSLLVAANEYISSSSSFVHTGGTNQAGTINVGPGSYQLSGAGIIVASSENVVSTLTTSSATFAQNGGVNTAGTVSLGYDDGNGLFTLAGTSVLSATTEEIGDTGTGTFMQSGGSNTVAALAVSYNYYASTSFAMSGAYNLSGSGVLTVTGTTSLGLGVSTHGVFSQTGGTSSLGVLGLGINSTSSGTCNLDGGLMRLAGLSAGSGTASFNFSGGTIQSISSFTTSMPMALSSSGGGATFDSAGYNLTLSGSLRGLGSLTKIDSGTLMLAAANTYSGNTLIAGGTLKAGGVNTLSASSAVTISSGTLDASGFANKIAALDITSSASGLNLGLGNLLTSAGSAVLNGTLNVSGSATLGEYKLLAYASRSGTFSNVTGLSSSYGLLYNANGTELDAEHKAQLGTFTATLANPTVITGGTSNLVVNATNAAPALSDTLNFVAGVSGIGFGLSATGSLAASTSGAFSVPGAFNSASLAPGNYAGVVTFNGSNAALGGLALGSGGTQSVIATVLDHSNASLSSSVSTTSETINFGNVLKGASLPSQNYTVYNLAAHTTAAYTANMKLTGFTTSGNTAVTTNLTTFNGLTASSAGNSYTVGLNANNYSIGSGTISMAASQLVDDSTLPGAGNNNNSGLSVVVQANVGNATADASNSQTSFGPALAAPVAQNGSYANLASTVVSTTGSGGASMVGTTATILAGSNTLSGAAQSVSMAWRTRAQTDGSSADLISDVVDLSGMALSGSSGQTAPFVLQLSYDTGVEPTDSALTDPLYLAWLNPATNTWQNAVDGNYGDGMETFYDGPWQPGDLTVGDWGVDTANDTVWAVVNHNSEFAVVPEPGTMVLLGIGVMGFVGYHLQMRRACGRERLG